MTEAQWLASEDVDEMIDWLRKDWKHSLFELGRWLGALRRSDKERRLRLFACACLRHAWDKLPGPKDRAAVEVAERYAEGQATERELAAAGERYGIPALAETTETFAGDAASRAAHEAVRLIAGTSNLDDPARRPVRAYLCGLLRDIFGPLPFRSPRVGPRWRTPIVLSLAKAAYEERLAPDLVRPGWLTLDTARLLVLSDALEDAGCTDVALLGHLRGPGPHVRGCWALDLVLGKG
jgi:hypothetical protein